MSDTDDLPELVDSSDDDCVGETLKQSADHANTWLRKADKFLEKQDLWMRVFCLGPFLFGVNNIISAAWIKALMTAELLLNEKRQNFITFLEWKEWECVDLMDHVISHVQKQLRQEAPLTKVIDCVKRLEDCKAGVIIDVDLAIKEAEKVTEITDMWRSILKDKLSVGKEKAAKFAVLYVCKIYNEHVLSLSEKSHDFVDEKKKTLKKNNASKLAEEHKKKGNEHFTNERYEQSIECYKNACMEDPFQHFYYGNRSQAYIKLNQFREALADGRRAVTIKPDFAKGHYRYALAFYELGQLDTAIRVNEQGQVLCQQSKSQDFSNVQNLEQQGQKYLHERRSKGGLTSIPKNLEEQLLNIPDSKSSVDITEKFGCKVPTTERLVDNLSHLTPSTDSDVHISKKDSAKLTTSSKPKMDNGLDTIEKTQRAATETLQQLQWQKRMARMEREDFHSYLVDGSDSIVKCTSKNAMQSYHKALELLEITEMSTDNFGLDEPDIITLKYAFGIAAVSTGIHKNIMDGVHKFQEIIKYHQDIVFPLAYYGLGKAFVTLNRFPEAIDPLKSGMTIANNVPNPQVTWPGTKRLIEESNRVVLVGKIKELLQFCKFPPTPDAVCRYHDDPTDNRTVIYLTDPDFKGYIKLVCQMNCVITIHAVCWKVYKNKRNRQNDKDILDTECPTPDCTGYIIMVENIRPDSLSKKHVSEKYTEMRESHKNKKPLVKQKTTSESKMAKKQEKKEMRKQKRRKQEGDLTEEGEDADVIKDGASASAFVEEIIAEAVPLPDVKHTTVLKKDDLKVPKASKGKKSKKKKEKNKQILHLEVNFTDRKEETLENENTALSDENTSNTAATGSQAPFSVPSELKSQINHFEKSYTGNAKQLFKPDEITENLFSYFVDILQAHGPLAINDPKIQQELEVFPHEALEKVKQVGGLGDFLRQSLKFAVIDDVISLMSDAKRAREVAMLKRGEPGVPQSTQNVWKTVGKVVNNVDCLGESVALSTSSTISTIVSNTSSISTVTSAILSGSTTALVTSNSSTSLSSLENSSSSSFPSIQLSNKPWTSGGNDLNMASKTNERKSSGIDVLDSIDDDFALETNKCVHDLDDFDKISDIGSDYDKNKESVGFNKTNIKHDSTMLNPHISVSRSSSRSDLSEKSSKSDLTAEMMPKPLRPFTGSRLQKGPGSQAGFQMWDSLENDFDVSWNDVKKEDLESSGADLVSQEVRQATEDFVRKSDEKLVSELAESVVEKIYKGKTVSEMDRRETLNNVSSDIWKDFEKSANAGKMGGAGLWANTPAGADYSKNMGKFATDFMKKHYEKSEGSVFSPTSNINIVYPQKPSSPLDNVYVSQNNSRFNSPSSPSWSVDDGSNETKAELTPSLSSAYSSTTASSNTGYNLFSGPSWTYDPFNSSVSSAAFPPSTAKPSIPPAFIRPPLSASSYYQSGMQVPLHMPPGPMPPGAMPPFRPPNMNPSMMPPRLPMPSQYPMPPIPPPLFKVDTKDKESQVPVVEYKTEGTMTDVYEPYKAEYQKMKEERDQIVQIMTEHKSTYETVIQQYKANEQKIKLLEAEIANKSSKYELEKKNWKDERESYSEKIRQLDQHLTAKDTSERELKGKMEGQEKRVNELAIMAKDQRDKDLIEIKKFMDASEKYCHQAEVQLERAKSAEIEIIRSKLKSAKSLLERSHKEATYHQQHLTAFMKKHQDESKTVPTSLQETFDYWTNLIEKSEETLTKIKTDYQVQMKEIQNGKPLAELQPINIPSPPPVPESMKGLPFMGQTSPGFMMSRMQGAFPTRSPAVNGFGKLAAPQPTTPLSIGNGTIYNTVPDTRFSGSHSSPSLPSLAQLKPLAQPNGTSGLIPPRPLSGAKAPLTVRGKAPLSGPLRPPLRPLSMPGLYQPMSSFEKLVMKLQLTFPGKSKSEFNQIIQDLRQKRGGSLSGMTIEDIISQVTEIITSADRQTESPQRVTPTSQYQPVPSGIQVNAPPGLSSSWVFQNTSEDKVPVTKVTELFQEEEDPCVICHEEMTACPAVNLECGHKFHDECIRKWFQEQSTCPNCRVHTLLSDDFPSLG